MRAAWDWFVWLLRGYLIAMGAAATIGVCWFNYVVWQFERETGHRYASQPVVVSPVAERIASRFSPTLQSLATEHKSEAINSVDGTIQRWCVSKVWDPAVAAIPKGAGIATNAALDALCNLPMGEVASDLTRHAQASGHAPHWSIEAVAEGRR